MLNTFYPILRPFPKLDQEYLLNVVTPPVSEPVTYDDLSAWLKLDQNYDQALVTSLGAAAREIVETSSKLTLMQTTYDFTVNVFDNNGMRIPRRPVTSIVSVKYIDQNNVLQTLDPSLYTVSQKSVYSFIYPTFGTCFPVTTYAPNAVTIRFVAGTNTDPTQTPNIAATAIMMYAEHLYANRGDGTAVMPDALRCLINLLNAPEV